MSPRTRQRASSHAARAKSKEQESAQYPEVWSAVNDIFDNYTGRIFTTSRDYTFEAVLGNFVANEMFVRLGYNSDSLTTLPKAARITYRGAVKAKAHMSDNEVSKLMDESIAKIEEM